MSKYISNKERLASLDILRGFDLFLLVFFQPVFTKLARVLEWEWLEPITRQFAHESWDASYRMWDMVMPLFLFMAGASMPFAFSKYIKDKQEPRGGLYRRILRRFVLLYLLGGVVQGNFLGLDPNHIYFYSNTLQTIAIGYLVSSILLLHCSLRWQIIVCVILLIIYWIPMTFCGDFTPNGNFAEKVDRLILGRFRDGVHWDKEGNWHFSEWYHYTWIWSSLNFCVTVMLGTFAGQIMKQIKEKEKVWKWLAMVGIALLAGGWLWDFQMPINKIIWSSSMVLWAGGWSFLAMALFYYWIDYKGHTYGLNWLKIYGTNSIAAYVLGETISFRSVVTSVSYGLEPYLGEYYSVWVTFGNFFIVFLILRIMYKNNYFLKV